MYYIVYGVCVFLVYSELNNVTALPSLLPLRYTRTCLLKDASLLQYNHFTQLRLIYCINTCYKLCTYLPALITTLTNCLFVCLLNITNMRIFCCKFSFPTHVKPIGKTCIINYAATYFKYKNYNPLNNYIHI